MHSLSEFASADCSDYLPMFRQLLLISYNRGKFHFRFTVPSVRLLPVWLAGRKQCQWNMLVFLLKSRLSQNTWYVSHVNSDALLDYLLIWKSFFRSPSQLLTNTLALCLETYGLAYCEASYLANLLRTSYSALIPHADTLTPKQRWSSWLYLESAG